MSDEEQGWLVVDQHFAIVPEWVIDAEISDAAFRLYSVLLRQEPSSGARMPSRATLARRLRKRSTDSVDRAMKELVAVGAVVVERRPRGLENLTNRYHLMSVPPSARSADTAGGRTDAANPADQGSGRRNAATPGRSDAARVAARVRPDPGVPTQENPPPPPRPSPVRLVSTPTTAEEVEALCRVLGVEDLDQVAADCRATRRRLGLPTGLWTTRAVTALLAAAVHDHGWPAEAAVPAILALAAHPDTRSPARLLWQEAAERATAPTPTHDVDELAGLEARLIEADGHRVRLQRLAREQLTAEGAPVTRLGVARHACDLLVGAARDGASS